MKKFINIHCGVTLADKMALFSSLRSRGSWLGNNGRLTRMFTPSRGCFHDASQLMRRGILCSQPHGVQHRANTAHLHHEKITPRVSRLNNVLIKSRRIIKSGKEAKYFELFPCPHSCLIVSDKSGNGECDIVKYFHSISVKYSPPQAENIFRDSQLWDEENLGV